MGRRGGRPVSAVDDECQKRYGTMDFVEIEGANYDDVPSGQNWGTGCVGRGNIVTDCTWGVAEG